MPPSAVQEHVADRTARKNALGLQAPSPRAFEPLARRGGVPHAPAPPGMARPRRESAGPAAEAAPGQVTLLRTETAEFYYRATEAGATVVFCECDATCLRFPDTLGGVIVTRIAENAAADLTSVESAILPRRLREIGEQAFARCLNLKDIEPGCALESIGSGAFRGCRRLAAIDFPDTLRHIGTGAFSNTSLQRVRIPASCAGIEPDALCTGPSFPGSAGLAYASSLQEIVVEGGNPSFSLRGGVLARTLEHGSLEAVLCPGRAQDVDLSRGFSRVSPTAFAGTTAIGHLRLPEQIELPQNACALPHLSCDHLTICFATPRGGATQLGLELPQGAARTRILSQAFEGQDRIRPEAIAAAYDGEIAQLDDDYDRTRLMAARLARPVLLADEHRAHFTGEAARSMLNLCVHAGGRNDWRTLDDALASGALAREGVSEIVSALNRFGFALAAAHVLKAARERFGEAHADYDL